MAVSLNQYFNFKALGEMYLQQITFSLDYRLTSGTDIPIDEMCGDFRSHFQSWILAFTSQDYHIYEYRLGVYDHLTYTAATDDEPEKMKEWFGEQHIITGTSADVGSGSTNPLPTYVTVSGRKVPTGSVTWFNSDGTYVSNQVADTAFRGKMSVSGLLETFTQNAQGNKLAVSNPGSNWLSTWNTAMNAFVKPSFRVGTIGGVYESTMQIKSNRGPGGSVRKTGEDTGAYMAFRPVSSVVCNEFVGSQISRKQVKKFQ